MKYADRIAVRSRIEMDRMREVGKVDLISKLDLIGSVEVDLDS